MAFIESGQTINKEKYQRKMRKYMKNLNRTKFTIRIPNNVLKLFKKKVVEDNTNINECLNNMILKYIEN